VHGAGIAHGAINTRTVFLSKPEGTSQPDYQVKLLDTGLSSLANTKTESKDLEIVAFQSPEFFTNIYGEATDVWSCGVLLYTLL
jgi:serine/threonine protein kinase